MTIATSSSAAANGSGMASRATADQLLEGAMAAGRDGAAAGTAAALDHGARILGAMEPVPPPDRAAEPDGFVVVVDPGDRIHFLDWGGAPGRATGGGPGVLLIHGLSNTAWSWAPVARRLRGVRHVVAMDLRGHGLSDAPTEGYDDADVLAGDVVAVAEGSGLLADGRATGSSSPATGSGRSSRPGRQPRSASAAPGSSSSMAAGSRSRPRPASMSTSSCAASTSRPRSCARWRRSSPTARRSTRRPGTPTRSARPGRRSSRPTPARSCRRRDRTRSRPASGRCSDTTRSTTLAAVEAPVVARWSPADDETGSRAAALAAASAARASGRPEPHPGARRSAATGTT